jgi:hypothetical protein
MHVHTYILNALIGIGLPRKPSYCAISYLCGKFAAFFLHVMPGGMDGNNKSNCAN